jgi:hypothetical protein
MDAPLTCACCAQRQPPEGVKEKGAGQDKSPKSWRGKVKDDL